MAGTKLALINAAGELFADHGLEGTSVRAIAEKAGANVAAINYHFGSKENLYTEVLRYVVLKGDRRRPSGIIADQDERLDTPEGIAGVIYQIVMEEYTSLFTPDFPRWYGRLLMRSLLDPSPSLHTVVEQIFQPDHEALKAIVKRVRPDMSEREARLWALAFLGQIAFFEFARVPILILMEKDTYPPDFLTAARDHLARMIISGLGLPQPKRSVSAAVAPAPV